LPDAAPEWPTAGRPRKVKGTGAEMNTGTSALIQVFGCNL
jgi:hypothetical protein